MLPKPVTRPENPRCTAIVCAYNEERHLASVLDGLLLTPFIDEIVVVDDGSHDRTPRILRRYAGLQRIVPIFLPANRGKGYAMAEGVAAATGDILLFVDADLVNWNADYARQVLTPLWKGWGDMVIGVPVRTDNLWDTMDVVGIQRWLSGERAVWRQDLLPILPKIRPSRFGVETIINMHYRTRHQPIRIVKLHGLVHVIKFEKMTGRQAWQEYVMEVRQILLTFVRHPLLAIMTYVPDLIDMRNAALFVVAWVRKAVLKSTGSIV